MDAQAVWMASDNDLISLGLHERGHLICLKQFCMPDSGEKSKENLAAAVKYAGQERVSASKKNIRTEARKRNNNRKTIQLGWKHFNTKRSVYVAVRASNDGGTRSESFPNEATSEEILDTTKNLFFPKGKCKFGRLECMDVHLATYGGEPIVSHEFTLADFIHERKQSKTRLYLMSKKKNRNSIILNHSAILSDESEDDSSGDDFVRPTFRVPSSMPDSPPPPPPSPPPPFRDQPFDVQNSSFTSPSSALIGASEERQMLQNQINVAYEESLHIDSMKASENMETPQQRPRSTRNVIPPVRFRHSIGSPINDHTSEVQNDLLVERLSQLSPEPELADPHLVMSVRHHNGTLRRLFRENAEMQEVYDWIACLPNSPSKFNIFVTPDDGPISTYTPARMYTNIVLNMSEIDEQESIPAINPLEVFEKIKDSRISARSKLRCNIEIPKYDVDRYNVIEELFDVYKDENVNSQIIGLNFKGEDATGDGVTKDVYSMFFNQVFDCRSSGIHANVPTSLSAEEAVMFGKILQHSYIQYNIFPYQLSKAVYEYVMFDTVRDHTLLDSFMLYIQANESEVLNKLLTKEEFINEETKEIVLDVLMDCGVNGIPNDNNIGELIMKAAKNVFIQKPFFILKQLQNGIEKSIWNLSDTVEFDIFWSKSKPTTNNLLNHFTFEQMLSPAEERIASYFTRYIRGSEENTRCLLMQFCTGSANVDDDKVSVRFVNQERTLRILSKACFKLLFIPRQIDSFKQFKTIVDDTLNNQSYWTMHDA